MSDKKPTRPTRKEMIGTVISDKMNKTIVVRVDRLVRHPKYNKVLKRSSKFKVHDEEKKAKTGDKVRISETRPLSKEKRWRLVQVL
jgi:small subunit ribosomal protein S17